MYFAGSRTDKQLGFYTNSSYVTLSMLQLATYCPADFLNKWVDVDLTPLLTNQRFAGTDGTGVNAEKDHLVMFGYAFDGGWNFIDSVTITTASGSVTLDAGNADVANVSTNIENVTHGDVKGYAGFFADIYPA